MLPFGLKTQTANIEKPHAARSDAFCRPRTPDTAGDGAVGPECAIFIDLDSFKMIVFVDGKPYKTYPVSGGRSQTPSPVGTWKVIEIYDKGGVFGGSWIGLNVPWGGYGIHGAVQPWAIGEYHLSHGCIRMRDEDVRELKKIICVGTLVHIKYDGAPFRAMKKGMAGSDVQKTQLILKNLGYDPGAVNGIYGAGTERAVRKFQRDNGLEESGVVDRRTYDRIIAFYDE